jgi:hypothetical protein
MEAKRAVMAGAVRRRRERAAEEVASMVLEFERRKDRIFYDGSWRLDGGEDRSVGGF